MSAETTLRQRLPIHRRVSPVSRHTGTEELESLPLERPSAVQRLGYLITNPSKNFLLPAAWLKRLLGRSHSPLVQESFRRPGGWRSMEYVYRNDPPVDWIDRQALRDNPLSMAARNRRLIVRQMLISEIQRFAAQGPVSLLGVGAGPGWHIQSALASAGVPISQMQAYLIDVDADAFPKGRQLAAAFHLDQTVHFLQGDARQVKSILPDVPIQIAKLVGIIEYLNDEELRSLLSAIREVMPVGGVLITHGLVDRYGIRWFLSRVFGLRHQVRNARQLTRLLAESGFEVTQCEYEPTGIHPIVRAVRVGGE